MWKVILILIYLVILSIMDMREKQVPLYLLLVGLLLSMTIGIGTEVNEGYMGGEIHPMWIAWKLLLGLLPGIFFLGMAWFTGNVGKADGIVLMILGFLTNYRICMIIFSASLLLASAFSLCMMALRRINKTSRLPYIPFLAAAYIGYQIYERSVME